VHSLLHVLKLNLKLKHLVPFQPLVLHNASHNRHSRSQFSEP